MGKRTAAVEEEVLEETAAPEVEEATEVEEAPEETSSKGSVTVTWQGGTREYSSKVHGKDFKKLAAGFAEKFNGKVA